MSDPIEFGVNRRVPLGDELDVLNEQFKVACERAEHYKAALNHLREYLEGDDDKSDIRAMMSIINKGLTP